MESISRVTTPVEALVERYEYRLDTMAEEYEALLKDANRRIEKLEARGGILARMIEDIKELIV